LWVLWAGFLPSIGFFALYRPSRWLSWRTVDIAGIRLVLALLYAWQLERILFVGRSASGSWEASAFVSIGFGLLIDLLMWVRFLCFVRNHRQPHPGRRYDDP
jgi:hypothetical protein